MYGLWQPTSRVLKGPVCSLAYELAVTWCQSTFIQKIRVNSHSAFAIDDSTINIVLVVIIIIIIIVIISHVS